MGLFDRLSKPRGIRIRCGMCKVVTTYPEAESGKFVFHTCDADLLVQARDAAADEAALDLFVAAFGDGTKPEGERVRARDRLLYESGEAAIPGLEDLLWRLKYAPEEGFPFAEIAKRLGGTKAAARIDWGNELEMYLHRMKKFAITRRGLEAAGVAVKPILAEKLERLKGEPLVPLEED